MTIWILGTYQGTVTIAARLPAIQAPHHLGSDRSRLSPALDLGIPAFLLDQYKALGISELAARERLGPGRGLGSVKTVRAEIVYPADPSWDRA